MTFKLIKDFPNYRISEYGEVQKQTKTGWRTLKLATNGFGYKIVSLTSNSPMDKRFKKAYLHRLMAETFFPIVPENCIIEHLDSDPGNNHISNLKISDQSQNLRRARDYTGVGNQKLKYHQAELIRSLYSQGYKQKDLAELFEVSQSLICRIVNNQIWL